MGYLGVGGSPRFSDIWPPYYSIDALYAEDHEHPIGQILENEDKTNLASIDRTLKEILKWTRFENISKLKEILEKELDTDEKRLAYESTDGANGLKEVATVSGVPLPTVGTWWQKWFRLGLVTESEERKGRMVKIVSLDDVGAKIPKKSSAAQISQATAVQQSETGQLTQTEKDKGGTS